MGTGKSKWARYREGIGWVINLWVRGGEGTGTPEACPTGNVLCKRNQARSHRRPLGSGDHGLWVLMGWVKVGSAEARILYRLVHEVFSFLYFLKIKISKIYVRFEIFQKYPPVAPP